MAFNTNITPGRPPLLWSDVHEAFTKVNENFDILVATIGSGSGLTPIDFETLDTSVSPTTSNTYQLGSISNQWKSVHTSEFTTIDPLNGLWAGNAQIKGVGLTVNLPENSTVGGDPLTGIGTRLIIDPTRVFFKEVQIDNNNVIVAQEGSNKLGINSGSGISMTVDSSAESVEIVNTGILSISNGTGITGSTVSGVATVTNDGVVSFANSTTLPVSAAGRTAGAGIIVSAVKGSGVNITNTGVLDIQAGSAALTVSKDTATGIVTITNPSPAQNAFTQIEIDGDSGDRLLADSVNDVLNLVGSAEIILTKNSATDTVTFALNPVFDLKGSVFGDDSSVLVDAVESKIVGNIETSSLRTSEEEIALGRRAGETNQGSGSVAIGAQSARSNQGSLAVAIGADAGGTSQGSGAVSIGTNAGTNNQSQYAVAVGYASGGTSQGQKAVAVGYAAGQTNQGANAVAIGNEAGDSNQPANSIIINASGASLNGAAAGLYIDPIRSTTSAARPVVYDTTTKELFYTSTLEFINSTISTTDSSGITLDVLTTFNSDVVVENDLTVAASLTVNGSRVINLDELKSVVAASTDFADFQIRIAALV